MTGICFFYEDTDVDVWSGRDLDAWNYACKIGGGIESAIVINKTDQELQSFDQSMDVRFVDDFAAAQALMSGEIIYMACPWDNFQVDTLAGYPHTAVWYVLGPAAGWGGIKPGPSYFLPQAGTGAAHSVHVATALMFHRYWTLNP